MKYKILTLVLSLLFHACSDSKNSGELLIIQDTVMTVPYRILIDPVEGKVDSREVHKLINSTFHEIDVIYNKWNPHSELSKINRMESGLPIPLSPELNHFLHLVERYVKSSNGAFDPTVEPIQRLWIDHLEKGKLPDRRDLENLSESAGWDKIELKNGFLIKQHKNVQLDLGGIVKGFAVDLLVERLNSLGYVNVFVEWGGEIRTSGNHPENRPWNVFITRLGDSNPENAIGTVCLSNNSIATSGDYLQQWTVNSVTYTHIINPHTHTPLIASHTSIASVTVMSQSCMEADVLATTAMLLETVPEAEEWLLQFPSTKFWVYSRQSIKQN